MKSLLAVGFALVAGLVGVVAPVASALATENHHGTICQPQSAGQVSRFYYAGVGIEALSSGGVMCPLVTTGKNITKVEINVYRTDIAQPTYCSVSGVDWNGESAASVSVVIPAGQRYKYATIPEIIKGTYFAYSVNCNLPTGQVLTSLNVYP